MFSFSLLDIDENRDFLLEMGNKKFYFPEVPKNVVGSGG